jgi:CBS-domain-containing membrane protein
MQAQDVMTTVVATIPADATVQQAAKLMLERRISALPVMDSKDCVIGVVSEGDLVRRSELGTEAARSWWLRAFAEDAARDYVKTHGARVRDVMTSPAVTVRRTTPLHDLARLLEKHRIKRVPVLEAGRLVGVVSRADLVRRLATAPAAPARTAPSDRGLRKQVLKQVAQSGVEATYVNVIVERGTVHLWGGVRAAAEQKALCVAARAAGARRVEDHTFVMPPRLLGALGAL